MDGRLFGRQPAHPNPLFGDAVIFAELSQRTVSQLVCPRIADVHECRRHHAVVVLRESDRNKVVPIPKCSGFSCASSRRHVRGLDGHEKPSTVGRS